MMKIKEKINLHVSRNHDGLGFDFGASLGLRQMQAC